MRDRLKLSSYLWENPGFDLDHQNLPEILKLRTPAVPERAERLFKYLAKKLPNPGSSLSIVFSDIRDIIPRLYNKDPAALDPQGSFYGVAEYALPLMAASWSQEQQELHFLLNDYLIGRSALLERFNNVAYKVSSRGWEFLSKNQLAESDVCFVAMSFAKELDSVYQMGIEAGILGAGYRPVRIDKHQHVNRIDDEIIAQLRRSKFVVADFTGQRNGVYFEAGFALGLGLPVFWTCRSDDLKNVHFDARQYNAIKWEPAAMGAFATALTNRIVAIIGQGTFKK